VKSQTCLKKTLTSKIEHHSSYNGPFRTFIIEVKRCRRKK